ncbi:hypothetical protein JTB14_020155 [Gonioctena quinquepunctata]|nr:hypothetical protein JTB14_020155 [Gonioctena quinquepunctata]
MTRRSSTTSGVNRELQLRSKQYAPTTSNEEQADEENKQLSGKRKRCGMCQVKRTLTKYSCKNCKTPICLMHIDCYGSDCSKNFTSLPQPPLTEEDSY